jgi:NitT/TauT family transport system permease protein
MIALVSVWWLITLVFHIRSFFLPAPPDIVKAFLRLPGYLIVQTKVTLVETLAGFTIAVVLGLALALILVSSPLIERAILPLLVAGNAIPKLAVAPLLVVWMGFGQAPKIVMVLLTCIFPIIVSTSAGLSSTPADLGELATSLRASRWHTFVKVRLPWALPQIFVGLKVAITLAVIGAVVGEFSAASEGLGYVVVASGQQADTPLAFAAIALLALISIVLFYIVVAAERLLLPWVRETSV